MDCPEAGKDRRMLRLRRLAAKRRVTVGLVIRYAA